MKLQTDPTVIYGLTKGPGSSRAGTPAERAQGAYTLQHLCHRRTAADAIANPGRESIAAALNPDSTEYLFFVADGDRRPCLRRNPRGAQRQRRALAADRGGAGRDDGQLTAANCPGRGVKG